MAIVSMSEARNHLRADSDIPDTDIQLYLDAAIQDIKESVGEDLDESDKLAKLAVCMRLDQFRRSRDGVKCAISEGILGLVEKIRCRPGV